MPVAMYVSGIPDQFEIREVTASGGRGLFAKRHMRQGELIVDEVTFMVSASHLPGSKATWRDVMLDMRNDNLEARHVEDAMKGLSQEKLDEFRATYRDATSDLHRFQIISYDICPVFGGPPSAFAVSPVGPYLNHACLGNFQYSWDEASQMVHLRALEDIAPGDQIYIRYMIDGDWWDTRTRKAELHLIYDFDCGCPLCSDPEKSAASDSLRELIRPLQQKLKAFMKPAGPSPYSGDSDEDADQYVDFVERELGGMNKATGLPHHADVRLADAYRLAAKCKKDPDEAQRLREKAIKIDEICFGLESPHVAMQERMFEEQFARKS